MQSGLQRFAKLTSFYPHSSRFVFNFKAFVLSQQVERPSFGKICWVEMMDCLYPLLSLRGIKSCIKTTGRDAILLTHTKAQTGHSVRLSEQWVQWFSGYTHLRVEGGNMRSKQGNAHFLSDFCGETFYLNFFLIWGFCRWRHLLFNSSYSTRFIWWDSFYKKK